jgi:hypothetical protein
MPLDQYRETPQGREIASGVLNVLGFLGSGCMVANLEVSEFPARAACFKYGGKKMPMEHLSGSLGIGKSTTRVNTGVRCCI